MTQYSKYEPTGLGTGESLRYGTIWPGSSQPGPNKMELGLQASHYA